MGRAHLGTQYPGLELGDLAYDAAVDLGDYGDAGVGVAQQRASQLQGAHPGNFHVLPGAYAGAEPSVVGDRQQEVGVRLHVAAHLVREDDLVADGGGKLEPLGDQVRLHLVAPAEGGHGQVEEGGYGAQQIFKGHELADGQQVVLVVAVLVLVVIGLLAVQILHPHAEHCIEEALLLQIVMDDPRQQAGVVHLHRLVQALQIGAHLLLDGRDRRFRPDDDVGVLVLATEILIGAHRGDQGLGIPFEGLGYVALHQGHLDRLAPGHPVELHQPLGGADQHDRQQQPGRFAALPGEPEGGGGEQQGEGDALHPENGGEALEGAVYLGVAKPEPGIAGHHPAPQPVGHQPECREGEQPAAPVATAKEAGEGPAGQGRIEGQIGAEAGQQHEGGGQRNAAKLRHADMDPPLSRQKQPHGIAEAAPGRLLGVGLVQQGIEAEQGEDHQRPVAERGEGQHGDGARGQGEQACQKFRFHGGSGLELG
ncbi:hypothetical protein D3C80_826350 [compost metagenome]